MFFYYYYFILFYLFFWLYNQKFQENIYFFFGRIFIPRNLSFLFSYSSFLLSGSLSAVQPPHLISFSPLPFVHHFADLFFPFHFLSESRCRLKGFGGIDIFLSPRLLPFSLFFCLFSLFFSFLHATDNINYAPANRFSSIYLFVGRVGCHLFFIFLLEKQVRFFSYL